MRFIPKNKGREVGVDPKLFAEGGGYVDLAMAKRAGCQRFVCQGQQTGLPPGLQVAKVLDADADQLDTAAALVDAMTRQQAGERFAIAPVRAYREGAVGAMS